MNEAGQSVGPARGALKVPLDHVLVLHDEIDLPFGEIRVRVGGGLAGHNGLKSLKQGLGSADFARVRVGVGRPPTTDPDRVAAYVLGRFRGAPRGRSQLLIEQAADAAERAVVGESRLRPRLQSGCSARSSPTPTTIRRPPRSQRDGGRAFVSQSLRPYLLAALLDREPDRPAIVVAGDDRAARDLAAALRTWLEPARRPLLPEPRRHLRVAPGAAAAPRRPADRGARRAARVRFGRPRRSSSSAPWRCRRRFPTRRCARTASCCAAGELLDLDETARDLVAAGYERVDQVEDRGQFAIRGGLLDVFPGDRGPGRARRPVRRRDRVAALVLDLHAALARRRRASSRSRRPPSSPRSIASWPRSPRSRRRPTVPTSPSCSRSRTSTRSWSSPPRRRRS